jgi:predicted HTH domain antitoxin
MGVVVPEAGFGLKEASVIAGMPRSTFYEQVRKKRVPLYEGLDGRLKISRDELLLFICEREQES